MKNRFIITLSVLAIVIVSNPSFGQHKSDTLLYTIGMNITGRKITGTFKQMVVGGGLNVDLLYNNWHLENKTTYRYNKTNERKIEDNWYDLASLKYYPKGQRKLYPGVFYHFDNSLMYRVDSRHQIGLGLGSELDKGAMKLSLIAAVANEQSTFNGDEFVNSELDTPNRKNGIFMFKLNNGYAIAQKKINFSYQLFYFQSLKERADYDIWLTSRLSFKVIRGLSIFAVYDYRFENVHLESLSNYNAIILFGFNWTISGRDS